MNSLTSDTASEAQHVRVELMRRLPDWRRLTLACELTQALRELLLADIRHRYPNADEEEVRRRFIGRVLSREDVIRAYGFDPKLED